MGLSRRRGPDGRGVPPCPAAARRPAARYLDNGSPFVDAWLLRGCAVLGIRLIHSRPGKPEGRGKIERFFRTVRDQYLVEIGDGAAVPDLAEMNRLFHAWTETVYHQAVHSGTGEEPVARWAKASPAERAVPDPAALREAFLWSERRKATKTALVSLHGNSYQVDAHLAGRYVELVFDPFDPGHVEVRAGGKPAGTAVPFTVGRHRHPKTRTRDDGQRTEPAPTGINYLAALGDVHDAGLKDQVSYRSLIDGRHQEQEEGQTQKGEGRE